MHGCSTALQLAGSDIRILGFAAIAGIELTDLWHERLFIDEIDDAIMLAKHAEGYRVECNEIRPPQAHCLEPAQARAVGQADPTIPSQTDQILPTTDGEACGNLRCRSERREPGGIRRGAGNRGLTSRRSWTTGSAERRSADYLGRCTCRRGHLIGIRTYAAGSLGRSMNAV